MVPSHHRIRRQRWLVRTDTTAAALAWRTFLAQQGQDLILPLFEQAFAEIGGDNRFIHLARMELHLSLSDTDLSFESLSAAVLVQLRQNLESLLPPRVLAAETAAARWQEATSFSSQFDLVLHYLRTGYLPWYAAGLPDSPPTPALTAIIQSQWSDLLEYLQRQPESPIFYWRLLHLLPEAESRALLTSLRQGNNLDDPGSIGDLSRPLGFAGKYQAEPSH